jgi:hypothetical protein
MRGLFQISLKVTGMTRCGDTDINECVTSSESKQAFARKAL